MEYKQLCKEFYDLGGLEYLEKIDKLMNGNILIQTACMCNNRYAEGGCCSQAHGTIYLPVTIMSSNIDIDGYIGEWNTMKEIKDYLQEQKYFFLPPNNLQ